MVIVEKKQICINYYYYYYKVKRTGINKWQRNHVKLEVSTFSVGGCETYYDILTY